MTVLRAFARFVLGGPCQLFFSGANFAFALRSFEAKEFGWAAFSLSFGVLGLRAGIGDMRRRTQFFRAVARCALAAEVKLKEVGH